MKIWIPLVITAAAFLGAATPLPTLDGRKVANSINSDCQPYALQNNTVAINCPVRFIPVIAAAGVHTVQQNEFGSVLVATGGGVVQYILPSTVTQARNTLGFATDSNTGFSISAPSGTSMQGSALINNNTITVGPNYDAWAGLSGTVWQMGVNG